MIDWKALYAETLDILPRIKLVRERRNRGGSHFPSGCTMYVCSRHWDGTVDLIGHPGRINNVDIHDVQFVTIDDIEAADEHRRLSNECRDRFVAAVNAG